MYCRSSTTTWTPRRRLVSVTTTSRLLLVILLWTGNNRIVVRADAPPPREYNDPVQAQATGTTVRLQYEDEDEEEESSLLFQFVHKTIIIPHDDKLDRGGEDAAACTDAWLVVADGVGGWADEGVDPGLFSRQLVQHVIAGHPKQAIQSIFEQANTKTAAEHLGSATCTGLRVNTAAPWTVETLNVGDSGYSIHRRNNDNNDDDNDQWTVVFASEPGQQAFNFPHQLGGQYGHDVHQVGVSQQHKLQPGDVIVVYSDGVSDNVVPEQFHECLTSAAAKTTKSTSSGSKDDDNMLVLDSYSWAADCIARTAYFLGKDETFDSPFAVGARLAGKRWQGGKHDDITVVVAQLVPQQQQQQQPVDPYRPESQYLYTGPVGTVQDLPNLQDLLHKASSGGSEEL